MLLAPPTASSLAAIRRIGYASALAASPRQPPVPSPRFPRPPVPGRRAVGRKNRVGGPRRQAPQPCRGSRRQVADRPPGYAAYSYKTVSDAHDMQARYYSPILKRFLNEDPAGFAGGRNLYAYCMGDPVNAMDPFGLGAVETGRGANWSGQNSFGLEPLAAGRRAVWFEKATDIPEFDAGFAIRPNVFTLVTHGRSDSILGPDGASLNAQQTSDLLPQYGYKPGMEVDLIACYTGKGTESFGQQLANINGAPVNAPNDLIRPSMDGNHIIAPNRMITSLKFNNGQYIYTREEEKRVDMRTFRETTVPDMSRQGKMIHFLPMESWND